MAHSVAQNTTRLLPGLGCAVGLALAVVALALGACDLDSSPSYSTTPTVSAPLPTASLLPSTELPQPDDWPFRWLKGDPCRSPCWEGITPGQTTASEASEVLQNNPLIARTEIVTDSLIPNRGVLKWYWVDGTKGGEAVFNVSPPSSPIHVIYPYYPVSFRLGDVIQSYGDPTHIIARSYYPPESSEAYYDLRILYRPQGFILVDGGRRKPVLNAETDFGRAVFFAPNDDGSQAALEGAAAHSEWLIPWEGLRDFDSYCQDEVGKPCP